MASTSKRRYWYLDQGTGDRIAIVETGGQTVTREGKTSDIVSVSESDVEIRVQAIATQEDFEIGELSTEKTEIPTRFHDSLVFKVISEGYMDPRNMNAESANYFLQQYNLAEKRAKRFARSRYLTNGYIKQVDF
tara:strand:- start:326 stop:727 length:402 start_codon:yes stop_codon:yes gene_type:complete